MRFVLIRPPFVDLSYGPPIGLAHIQGVLREAGHNCVVFDINLDLAEKYNWLGTYDRDFVISPDEPVHAYAWGRIDDYCEVVRRLEPDVVGFHLTYPTREYGVAMAERLSEHVRCIAGGPEAAYNETDLLDLGCFDTIVSGYGEEAVLEVPHSTGVLSKPLTNGRDYVPDYTGIEIERYGGMLPLVTTRGCPRRCNFCTQNLSYHYQSIDSVMRQLRTTPDVRSVMFNDSNINVSRKHVTELFETIALSGGTAPSHVFGMEVSPHHDEYIPLMAKAGVFETRLGLESGSYRERGEMEKANFSNDLLVEVVKNLTDHKITTWVQQIFCFPSQTAEDREESLALMHRLNRECDPQYIKQFWYRFVVHTGRESYFEENFGVERGRLQTWSNDVYTAEVIDKLGREYKERVPDNCLMFV